MQQKPTYESTASELLPGTYQFNLSDFALFMSVMKVKEAYEDVLSIILDEPDLKLKLKAEQVILNKSGKRACRGSQGFRRMGGSEDEYS